MKCPKCQTDNPEEADFCFECGDFPCEEVNFEAGLREKWLRANERMREIGVEAYFNEVKDRSHYL